jgi:hypothetical protein
MSELEPDVQPQDLAREIKELRERVAEEHRRLDADLQPHIDAHIEAHANEVDRVIALHKFIGDSTDLEIGADTRWSAIWELSGRCLAICRVVLNDFRAGFTSEAIGSVRTLFEAAELLTAIAYHEEENALRRWLDGEFIRPKTAREVVGRKETLARQRMKEAGMEPEGRAVSEVSYELYDDLSKPAHNMRGGFPEAVSVLLREFTYGPHPNAEVRAHHLSYAEQFIETTLIVVIVSLSDIMNREREQVWADIGAMKERLERVRVKFPLPE